MEKLLLVKIGGSLITDKSKPFTARETVIRRLGREIKSSIKKFGGKIIIGHGSGSFGHTVAAKYQTQKGIINKNSVKGLSQVADAAVQINRIAVKNLLSEGLPAVSFSPASFLTSKNGNLDKVFLEPIISALKVGIIPVIYGDVIFDTKKGCSIFSAEKTLDILARKLGKKYKIERIIQASDVAGVYDENGRVIPRINQKNFKNFAGAIGASGKTDVTGGMRHKVLESLNLAKSYGIETLIISGKKNGLLKKALLGQKCGGTIIS